MNIIIEEEMHGRIEDGINVLLNLPDEQFNKIIEKLKPTEKYGSMHFEDIRFFYTTDGSERPSSPIIIGLEDENLSRHYFGGKNLPINELFEKIAEKKEEFSKDDEVYRRIERLINSRNISVYENSLIQEHPNDKEVLHKLFELLQNQDEFERFLNYDENQEEFDVKGKESIKDYLKYVGKIFGDVNKKQYFQYFDVYTKFYIPEIEIVKERVLKISEKFNIERYTNKKYEFRVFIPPEVGIRKEDEPEWNINPKLQDKVFGEMPSEFSLEEKAFYIYSKLCRELVYDEGYMYRDKINPNPYIPDFSKGQLEAIKPGSRVNCYDFSRVFAKMVNSLEGDIEAIVISQGQNRGHFLAGFYTDRISVRLEPINIYSCIDLTNDMMKAKAGVALRGIEIVSDRKGIIPEIIEKVYPLVTGKETLSIHDYMELLNQMPVQNEIPDELQAKLEAFVETMKESNICGNEFMEILTSMKKNKLFNNEIEIANIGRKEGNTYRRIMLIRKKKGRSEENNEKIFSIDTETLLLREATSKEIIKKMSLGEYVYEDNEHHFAEIDKGVHQ